MSLVSVLETDFDRERAAVLATAVGIARLKLRSGDVTGALEALDRAAAATHKLHRRFLIAGGMTEADVDALFGTFLDR